MSYASHLPCGPCTCPRSMRTCILHACLHVQALGLDSLPLLFTLICRCPNSWDHLGRVSMDLPNCSLLVSHDDFSVVSKLPEGNTVVFSHIRDPVERFLSAYEFAIMGAAVPTPKLKRSVRGRAPCMGGQRHVHGSMGAWKGAWWRMHACVGKGGWKERAWGVGLMMHPHPAISTHTSSLCTNHMLCLCTNHPQSRIQTSQVWPWSHLIAFFLADMKERVRRRGRGRGGGGEEEEEEDG